TGGARHPCAAASHRADRGSDVFHPVPAALHLRAAGVPWRFRLPVRRADDLRQAVQPGAVTPYRSARDPVGALCPPCAALGAVAPASLVPAGRRVRADHLSASLHRHPDRRAPRLVLPLALARSQTLTTDARSRHLRRPPPRTRIALRRRRALACC